MAVASPVPCTVSLGDVGPQEACGVGAAPDFPAATPRAIPPRITATATPTTSRDIRVRCTAFPVGRVGSWRSFSSSSVMRKGLRSLDHSAQ